MALTMSNAVAAILGNIFAKDGDSFMEFPPDTLFTITYGNYKYEMPIEYLQDLNNAHEEAHYRSQKAKCTRRDKKAAGRLDL